MIMSLQEKVASLYSVQADISPILQSLHERRDLEFVLIDVLNVVTQSHTDDVTCAAIISDPVYLNVFEGVFRRTFNLPFVMVSLCFTIIMAAVGRPLQN